MSCTELQALIAPRLTSEVSCCRAVLSPRDDALLSEDEDYGMELGQVQGPMLDYTRYYPTTLPMLQPRHDSSEASAAADEVRVAHGTTFFPFTSAPFWIVGHLKGEVSSAP